MCSFLWGPGESNHAYVESRGTKVSANEDLVTVKCRHSTRKKQLTSFFIIGLQCNKS